jgi:hypothetical protein
MVIGSLENGVEVGAGVAVDVDVSEASFFKTF